MGKQRKNKGKARALSKSSSARDTKNTVLVEVDADYTEPDATNDEILANALDGVGIVSVLQSASTDKQVKLRVRIANQSRWKHMLTLLLREESRARGAWNVHICQQYLLHEDRLVYTWNFILQSNDIDGATRDVCRLFDFIRSNLKLFNDKEPSVIRPSKSEPKKEQPKVFRELREYPLTAAQDRNAVNSKGKGASYIGA